MNRYCRWMHLACAAALVSMCCAAQNLDRRVAEAVATLTDGSAADCLAWCDRLVVPERRAEENDTEARMVLYGAALKAGEAEGLRDSLIGAFTTVLSSDRPSSIQAFILEMLQLVADRRALPVVARHLHDPVLSDRAVRVAVAVGGPEAVAILADALPGSKEQARLSLVQGLAEVGSQQAVDVLVAAAENGDRALRVAALQALAASGAAAAHDPLLEATRDDSAVVRARALAAYLAYLRRRARTGHSDEAVSRALAMAEANKDAVHVCCGVLDLLGRVGGNRAVDAVLEALESDSQRIRAAAGRALRQLPVNQTTSRLAGMLSQASPDSRVAVIDVLVDIGAAGALPALRQQVSSEHAEVRAAAVRAIGAIAGADALSELIPLLTDSREAVSEAARDAIHRMSDDTVGSRLAEAARQAAPEMGKILLILLAQRLDTAQTPSVIAMVDSQSPEIRQAAWNALGSLAGVDHVDRLAATMAKTQDSADLKAAQMALVAICRRTARPGLTGPALAKALEQSDDAAREAMLPVLPAAGGAAALNALVETLKETEGDMRTAATRALADWPDDAAMAPLRDIVATSDSEVDYVLAFRGYVRLLEQSGLPVARKLESFAEAMQLARRPDERKRVLAAIGAIQHRAGFAILRPFLNQEALRDEAASAIVRLALAVRGDDSIAALKAVMSAVDDGPVAERARDAMAEVAKYAGCVVTWQLSGPYTESSKGHTAIYPVPFPPEKEGEDAEWQRVTGEKDGRVDLKKILGGNNRCAYLRCNVIVSRQTAASLSVGSDDGIKVWLNGNVVHEKNVPRPFTWCEDTVEVVLLQGTNTLMMKITQGGGDWMANARIRGVGGVPIDGLNFEVGEPVRRQAAAPTETPREEDEWQLLFNTRDLANWQNSAGKPPASGWRIDGDCLALDGKGGYIWTRERFGDFVLDLEYNTEGNSGLFFRTDNPRDPVQTGIEMQVHTHETAGKHGVGAIYDLLAPAAKAAKPGWNHVTLTVDDNRIAVVLNGTQIIDMDLNKWSQAGRNPDGSNNKFTRPLKAYRRDGHIGFQDHGSPVRYRNIRVRRLP